MDYTTYTHRDVERLLPADGRALLRKLCVQGTDAELDKVVADWDGHALALSLLAAYLKDRYAGNVKHLADIPAPSADEPRYERIHRVLRRYDEHLTEAEREFLELFSAFRTPVHESAFEKVFRPLLPAPEEEQQLPSPSRRGAGGEVQGDLLSLVTRLVSYRILRHDAPTHTYTTHPLIRNYYFALLTRGDVTQQHSVHEHIKNYYLSLAGDTPQYPTLDDLKPLIEVVHHACQAGAYDEAINIVYQRIYQGFPARVLVSQLGAWETAYTLMLEFFPDGDTSQEPQVSGPKARSWILNEIGLCLMYLGRLREAVPFFERYVKGNIEAQDWSNASAGYRNLANLHAYLGALQASAESARQALDLARRAENKQDEKQALYYQGWIAHLRGDVDVAKQSFSQAEVLNREEYSNQVQYLHSLMGIGHADHLRRTGEVDYARRVTEANLQWWVKNYKWLQDESACYRILGDLDADSGQHESAREHYETALKIARGISHRPSLIEALLGRGRWAAKYASQTSEVSETSEVSSAFNDLNEALNTAFEGGYRIYEADIRVALAWAHIADLTPGPSPTLRLRSGQAGRGESLAKAKASRALQMSAEMGYYWGKVDAEEVLKVISDQ